MDKKILIKTIIGGFIFLTVYSFIFYKMLGYNVIYSRYIPIYSNPVFLGVIAIGIWIVYNIDGKEEK